MLSIIVFPLPNAMSHKTRTFLPGEKVVQMVSLHGTKWKNTVVDMNDVGQQSGCGFISLSKLSVIMSQQFVDYVTKKLGGKYAHCTACEQYKGL